MPYIYTTDYQETCKCEQSRPVAKETSKYPFGSIWMCPRCKSQWIKERDLNSNFSHHGKWRKLSDKEKLVYNQASGTWDKK